MIIPGSCFIPFWTASVPVVDCDPYWDQVVLAMHMNDNLIDSSLSPSVMTLNAGGVESYLAGKFDNGFNFNGSSWFWTGHTSKFDFGQAPVSFDLFYKTTSTLGYHALFGIPNYNTGSIYLWHKVSGGNKWCDFRYMDDGTARDRSFDTGYSSSYNEPIHLEIVRSGALIYFFIDGILKTTMSIGSTLGAANAVFVIGAQHTDGSSSSSGVVMDDLRITKGVARNTADFTPPTKTFPDFLCEAQRKSVYISAIAEGYPTSSTVPYGTPWPQYSYSLTDQPTWYSYFSEFGESAVLAWANGSNSIVDTGILPTKTLPIITTEQYFIYALKASWSGDIADVDLEFLNAAGNSVCAIRCRTLTTYANGVTYGNSLSNLSYTAPAMSGEGLATVWNAHISFTSSAVLSTPRTGGHRISSFSFACDANSITHVRISNVRAVSTYTGGTGGSLVILQRNLV